MTVFLHVGQAGVQIGAELWKRLVENREAKSDAALTAHDSFFADDGYPRALFVDSEPKPIASALDVCTRSSDRKSGKLPLRDSGIVFEQHGRGNNWGLGFYGPRGKKEGEEGSLSHRTLEGLRKEAERCDTFTGCFVTHSVAGGTGSGLGSRVIEAIREAYPKQFLLAAAVLPFSEGETALQHYNTLLTCAHLQRHADGVIAFSNEDILRLVHHEGKSEQRAASMHALNSYIVDCLLDVLSPTKRLSYYETNTGKGLFLKALGIQRSILLQPFELYDYVGSVCPLPTNKFVEIWSTRGLGARRGGGGGGGGGGADSAGSAAGKPGAASAGSSGAAQQSWTALAEQLVLSVPRFDIEQQPSKTLCCQVQVRGDLDGAWSDARDRVTGRLARLFPAVSWNPFPQDVKVTAEPPIGFGKQPRSITVSVNRGRIGAYLSRLSRKAKLQFDNKAYLHWFQRYGVEHAHFERAFEEVSGIIDNYAAMTADD